MAVISVHDISGAQRVWFNIAPIAQGTATQSNVIFEAPFACRIRSVQIFFGADVTGTATNYFNLNLINRGTDGAGTTELANRDYASGTNDSAFVKRALYAPSTYLAVAVNTVLDLQRELVAAGLAMPSLSGYVEFEGN